MLLKAGRTKITRDDNGFTTHMNMPGWIKHSPSDHGHGPLAMIVESILVPGRVIAMHEHRNDEIISWVPDGVMRHDDKTIGKRVTDSGHLLVENTGRSYWHSEGTAPEDPPLRMLQILLRPAELDLEPNVQQGPVPAPAPNAWRHLVGPEGGSAPFFIRNQVDFYDIRLEEGARAEFPAAPGRDLYFYVFTGTIAADGKSFAEAEQGLLLGGGTLPLEAVEPSVVVAFLIDPRARITRKGTIADHKSVPPALLIRVLRPLAAIGLGRFFPILNLVR